MSERDVFSSAVAGPPALPKQAPGEMPRREAPTFAIYTLGCKINQYDSNKISQQMRALGYRQVPFRQCADAYIIDTCTVTHVADSKSRKAVSRAVRKNPHAVVAVTGCAAEWAQNSFRRICEKAIVVGNALKDEVPGMITQALKKRTRYDFATRVDHTVDGPYVVPLGSRTRAILKIMEGCNRTCAFCIIPRVRGKPYSRPMAEVMAEARAMVQAGAREIVLTGVIVGWYGNDLPALPGHDPRSASQLPELLRALQRIDGLERIRISAIDPRDVGDDLIDALAACDKVMPHLHLVMQSGCDATLKAMRRGYDTAFFRERVEALRAALPDPALHTDVIVGFPGELEAHFEETVAYVKDLRLSGMHIFPYSKRPGTEALELPQHLSPQEIQRRGTALAKVEAQLREAYARRWLDRPLRVMVERRGKRADAVHEGFSAHYVRVAFHAPAGTQAGDLLTVTPQRWDDGVLRVPTPA